MRANATVRELEIQKFWEEHDIYNKIINSRDKANKFILHDGPPYLSSEKIHVGTALNKILKDILLKYKAQAGYYTPYVPGYDGHGLPIENAVVKNIKGGRNALTPVELRQKCREFAHKNLKGQESEFKRLGVLGDWEHPYLTIDPEFEAEQVRVFGDMYKKGYVEKGLKPVYWCASCETALAEAEVEYADHTSTSIYVRFKFDDESAKKINNLVPATEGKDIYSVIWTTTPWTLCSNIALCVNPDETYARVKAADGFTYIMAEALLDKVLGGIEREEGTPAYEIIEEYKGKDLEYKEYEPLYQCAKDAADKQHKKAFFVYCDNYVTMEDGTGIVHIAPAFGEDDARVGRKYDAPFVQMVDEAGVMKPETPFAGMRAKPTKKEMEAGAINCDVEVLKELEGRGILFSAPKVEHEYPHCWRCDTPLIYYARESWFIKMTDPEVKANLIANNKTINWIPETIGTGRFGAWLENVQDWGISRNRYWGTPLNIWQCEDCGEMMSIGSIEELKEKSDNCPDNIELHRPYVDAVTCKCPKCQGTMKRVPEVIDCWFDSGSMPFAQHHYPFENKELFEQQFPAKFISEAVDQTRGWFYSLLAISTLLFNKAPYENVIVLGHVQDADGQKMSKSKGNAVDPFDALQKHGADAIRWYFYENSAPWVPNRFKDEWVSEGQRKFMGTFWNTYAFFVLYANIDNFDATKYQLEYDKLSVMDKWLLSKLNSLVKVVDNNLENYKITETARALEDFTDELSNWYVRRSRERFWAKGMEQDKINAYMTLYTTLVTLAKISAPMVPFMTESIYRNLVCSIDKNAPISIHLCDFPKVNEQFIDKKLEETMDDVLDAVVIGRACRNSTNIKNRQPIGKMFIKADWKLDEFYTAIIADELNVKEVEYTDDVRAFTSYSFKPQMKTLGPKYGKLLNAIRTALTEVDGNATMDKLNESGSFELNVEGQAIELSKDDVLIEMTQKEGFVASSDKGITVVLDTNLTPELIEEGFVREVISKVQTMRKDAGFEVMDKINLYVSGNDKIADIVNRNAAQVKTVVLAQDIITGKTAGFEKEWDINGEKVTLAVEKLA
ncbi:TPA: isoleucine--tRNA ligase [Candidatus Gastranaerophilales bacterium HUM_20]|nr:MAG TPA: isoleucine--tRNA ligase [Candidatus Gastranaerophilales bacterium HUM_20]